MIYNKIHFFVTFLRSGILTSSSNSTPTHSNSEGSKYDFFSSFLKVLCSQITFFRPKKSSRHSKSFTSAGTKQSNTLQLDRKPEVIVSTNDLSAIGKSLDNSTEDKDILNVSNLSIIQASSVPNLIDLGQDWIRN